MKIFLVVLGAFLTLLGAGCTIGGTALLVITGGDGYFQSGTDTVEVRGAALVSGTEQVESDADGDDIPGGLRIRVRAEMSDGSPVFIGVGPAGEADRYLVGAPVDVVEDYDVNPDRIRTIQVPGSRTLEPPATQTFWDESVSGAGRQELEWEVDPGEFRVVVTPLEPREGFTVDVSAGVRIPFLRGLAVALIVGGVVVIATGVLLIILGARRSRRNDLPVEEPRVSVPPTP